MSNILATHAGLRLWSYGEDKWIAYNLLNKKRSNLSALVAAILVTFINGSSIEDAFVALTKNIKFTTEEFLQICEKLRNAGFLVDEGDESHVFALHIAEKWGQTNWIEAADYYLATYDYPFVTEGEGGTYLEADTGRMAQYIMSEPDLNRSKEYNDSLLDIPILTSRDALQALNSPFSSLFMPSDIKSSVTTDDIKVICAAAFGKLRERVSTNPRKASIVRKTSPSGGSRHPTEGYVVIIQDIEDLSAGVYHFSLGKNALEKISDLSSNHSIENMMPGVFRASFTPRAIFILTSLFERNMFRYREPRTFRTIFIDIGHVASTIKLICKGRGNEYFAHSYLDENEVEKMLNINKFREGAIYTIAVA